MDERILRLPAVKQRTGLSRSKIYFDVARGVFPEPISIGPRAVGWLESEISAWLAERIKASRPAGSRCSVRIAGGHHVEK